MSALIYSQSNEAAERKFQVGQSEQIQRKGYYDKSSAGQKLQLSSQCERTGSVTAVPAGQDCRWLQEKTIRWNSCWKKRKRGSARKRGKILRLNGSRITVPADQIADTYLASGVTHTYIPDSFVPYAVALSMPIQPVIGKDTHAAVITPAPHSFQVLVLVDTENSAFAFYLSVKQMPIPGIPTVQ